MRIEHTFTATIYVGLKHRPTGDIQHYDVARAVCQQYVNEVGLCVTFTPTEYIYTNGGEPGFMVGLINYPRFPSTPDKIREHALKLAERLMLACRQWKVSIVTPGETVMLESPESEEATHTPAPLPHPKEVA